MQVRAKDFINANMREREMTVRLAILLAVAVAVIALLWC